MSVASQIMKSLSRPRKRRRAKAKAESEDVVSCSSTTLMAIMKLFK